MVTTTLDTNPPRPPGRLRAVPKWRGPYLRGRQLTRVAVFIDYQNVYMGARQAFHPGSLSHVDGQIVKGFRTPHRHLTAVSVYRGLPSSDKDRKGYGAASRQVAMWSKSPLVHPYTRPLNYRDPKEPREKGIDVLLPSTSCWERLGTTTTWASSSLPIRTSCQPWKLSST